MRRLLIVGMASIVALAGCAPREPADGPAGTGAGSVVTSVRPPPSTQVSISTPETLPVTTTSTTITSSPTTTNTPLTPDQAVFQVRIDGGYVPQLVAALRAPSVTVYADGAVYLSEPDDSWGTPPRLLVGRSDPGEVAAIATAVAADGLLSRDFGSPAVTDMPETTVILRGPTGEQTGRVYALDFGVDFREGLSDDQVAWRTQLRTLVDDLRALATDPREWTPEQVRVLTVPYGNEPNGSEAVWPGPDLAQTQSTPRWPDGCLGVTQGASELYAAARANSSATWATAGGPMTLAVVAVLPGEPLC